MPWFWSSSEGKEPKKTDPVQGLDPSLQEFLKKEAPARYESTNPTTRPEPANVDTSTSRLDNQAPHQSLTEEVPKKLPPTAYKDGRYADLWKTYQPLAETEAEAKSDQDKINDVLEDYKHRRALIGRAALENCAFEQSDVNECFRTGSWSARMTMCRAENRKFDRCYTMQAKFLKALGYLSSYDRPPAVDEAIQMHADKLFHQMLDREKAAEEAKAEGKPTPEFAPLLSDAPTAAQPGEIVGKIQATDLSKKVQKSFKERLEGLSDVDRELEERAIKAEIQAGEQVQTKLGTLYQKQAEERRIRKEQGKETIQDKLASAFRGQ